ncbi:siderophore-interacting protein [Myroides guanonis]|uniref:NADPH-dependent ferric siderophore reductase, contains FAD-binding and SIP domains n=1 Tax=Myroides guanonis TaxID=1150112 RepID=A0A1I3NA53_9FLAO|nr:siderophore-interacting protein [Myroides guanonis]SFJ06072.1 NADPH-dependent ferric siderophore reductase, contains FAD-binding and SIP domains [Myroides guanonis]
MEVLTKLFYLKRRDYITPHYIRMTLESDSVSEYKEVTLGVNNKIFIAPDGVNKVYLPEYDEISKETKPLSELLKPIKRTYTFKGVDVERKEMYVDFVAHGDEGPASSWAMNAPIGAELGVAMKLEKGKALVPDVETCFLIGDATAIPVLGAILEELKEDVRVYVIIEIQSVEDIQQLKTKAKLELKWLINPIPGVNSELSLEGIQFLDKYSDEKSFAYVAAEFESVKSLRNHLRNVKGWDKEQFYAYSYWKYGKTESVSEGERREERNRVV